MLTIFNRRELICTMDMQKQAKIRQILQQNNIEYTIKTTNLRSASPYASGSRSRTGTINENLKLEYEYKIFIKKEDLDRATYIINKD